MTSYSIIKTPLDNLMLAANETELIGVYFVDGEHIPAASKGWKRDARHPVLLQAEAQLQEYFVGMRTTFSLPLRLAGTDFQERVWKQIALIPHGKTITYSELAQKAGAPRAIRAAGTSTGRNPISIIIPCHRVVGKDGGIGGYGGGLGRKRYLLELENSTASLRGHHRSTFKLNST